MAVEAQSVNLGYGVPIPVQPHPIPPAPSPVTATATPPGFKPPGFSMVIARSNPELDAYHDSQRVRDLFYPRSLEINTDTDPVTFFGRPFFIQNGAQYCFWLCHYIAFINEFHVGGYARQWYARTWPTMAYSAITRLVYDRVEDVFTSAELTQSGPEFLQRVLMYWQMNFMRWDEDNAAQSTGQHAQIPTQATIQHQQSGPFPPTTQQPPLRLTPATPTIRGPHLHSNDQYVVNSPPEQPRPISSESQLNASDQMSGEPLFYRGGGRSTRATKYSSVTLPARRSPAPLSLKLSGHLHIQDAFLRPTSPGAFYHQAGIPPRDREVGVHIRGPKNLPSDKAAARPTIKQAPVPRHPQDRPLPPQFSHVSALLGGPGEGTGRNFSGGLDLSRGQSPGMSSHGHIMSGANMPPSSHQQIMPFDPRTLVPPHVRKNLPPDMFVYQPVPSPEFVSSPGIPPLEFRPDGFMNLPPHGPFPSFPNHSLAFPNQSSAFSNHSPAFPNHSQTPFTPGRGNFGKGRGRGSFTGPNGRKGSINHKFSFQGSVPRYGAKEMARLPSGTQPILALPRKEDSILQEHQKGMEHVPDVERFPAYQDSGYVVHDQLLPEEKCSQKNIGLDVEEMTTLWIGSIAPGTTATELKEFIQHKVPVKSLAYITWPLDKPGNGWSFAE
jgi:hypothetical protein